MESGDKKKNNDVDKTTFGVRLSDNSYGNTFTNLYISGYDVGIMSSDSYDNKFENVQIISKEGMRLIKNLNETLQRLPIDEELKNYIIDSVAAIAHSKDKTTALESYTKLMSSLSDHVTVLTPVLPLMLQLSTHFC